MGLDFYVGSLTRYYSGDWILPVEQLAQDLGVPLLVIGEPFTKLGEGEMAAQTRAKVLAWKKDWGSRHGARFPFGLQWDESPRSPWFVDKPAIAGGGALQMWVADLEHPELRKPTSPGFSSLKEGVKCRASPGTPRVESGVLERGSGAVLRRGG